MFSGDLGRSDDLLMPRAASASAQADVLLVESTYGNRLHPSDDAQQLLGAIVRATVRRGGSVLLPSFAVGRAQALMLCLQRLKRDGRDPGRPAGVPRQPDGHPGHRAVPASTASCCAWRRARPTR